MSEMRPVPPTPKILACWVTSEGAGVCSHSWGTERARLPHAAAWALSLFALAVFYVLTFPFVESWGRPEKRADGRVRVPHWFVVYSKPIKWAGTFEWFKNPLDAYADWVIDRFGLD
jgi:hypothetical protein